MKYNIFTSISLLLIKLNSLYAQFLTDSLEYLNDTISYNNKNLMIHLNFNPFFKNNEYFNELYDGITFIGANINPYLSYKPTTKLTFSFGWYSRFFSGKEKTYINSLFYRINYQISKKLRLVMGNIYGYDFHQLIEPLYCYDNLYLHKPENGMQFLFYSAYFKSDLWLNWEKFILPNDNFKEEFIIGNSSQLFLTKHKNLISIKLPIQFVAKHKGGQVEQSTQPMQTYFNWATGIDVSIKTNNKNIGILSNYVQFNDVSDNKILKYTDGYGIYSNIYFHLKTLEMYAGYWFGEFYFSPIGEPLFQSLSKKYVGYQEPTKNLILFKWRYKNLEYKKHTLYLQFECYFDYQRSYFDFSYGLLLKLNDKYTLLKDISTYE